MPVYVTPVKADLAKGASAGQNLFETNQVRIFQVSGLDSFAPESRPIIAVVAVGIPRLGESHPDPNFSGMIVVDLKTESTDSHDIINVFAIYRWRNYLGSYLKSCGGSLRQEIHVAQYFNDVGTNSQNTPVMLSYHPPGSSFIVQQPAAGPIEIIEGIISFKFLEQIDPEYFNSTYPGFINSRPWRGYAERTMKILPIQGSTQDNFWYDNTYSFRYKSDTYDDYYFYKDQYGNTPPDVYQDVVYDGSRTVGNGWIRFAPIGKAIDFNLLFTNLPLLPPNQYGLSLDSLLGT